MGLTLYPTPATGSVTSVSSANGAATVATGTTTPVITIVSAPILTTARAIGGVNFDGSAAINPGLVISSKSADYTGVLSDANTCLLQTGATKIFTIPANASVAYAAGTALTFICTNATGCSIAITTDTMTLANSTTTGTRTLAQNGICTAIKLTSTTWLVSGTGLT
jgi:hypothetical protein